MVIVLVCIFMLWWALGRPRADAKNRLEAAAVTCVSDGKTTKNIGMHAPIADGVTVPCMSMSKFFSDSGTVYPLIVYAHEYVIKPYQQMPKHIQAAVVVALNAHWMGELATPYTDTNVREMWPDAECLYVLTTLDERELIGCMGIDRDKMVPFISNLLVVPKYRRRGYAERLLRLGEHYTFHGFGFREVKLWCTDAMLAYYEKRGWTRETFDEKNDVWVMRKDTSGQQCM